MKKTVFNSIVIILFCIFIFISYFIFFKARNYIDTFNNEKAVECTNPIKKEAYLTFDDGPCINNTLKILDILNENKVKATFFIVGKKGEEYPNILKKLSDNNMCIVPHTYCHDYKEVYFSEESYFEDLKKCNNIIKKITGKEPPPYVRFPGGSDNLVTTRERMKNLRSQLNEKGIYYVDWNVSSGDACSDNVPTYKIKQNIDKQCKDKDFVVILMHDAYYKKSTVEALPYIIKSLKDKGFVFKTFNDVTSKEKEKMIKLRILNRKPFRKNKKR